MQEIESKQPSKERAYYAVDTLITAYSLNKDKVDKDSFTNLFGDKKGSHLWDKWSQENRCFGGFFLNLETAAQIRVLSEIFELDDRLDFTLPELSDWREIGAEIHGGDIPDYFSEFDVRGLIPAFTDLTGWDCWPEDVQHIYDFCLYALNHSIDDKNYDGNKFGNFTNWAAYYTTLPPEGRWKVIDLTFDHRYGSSE